MRRSRVEWPPYQRCTAAQSWRGFMRGSLPVWEARKVSASLDPRHEREAILVARLRGRGREAHVLEVLRLLERGDEVRRRAREAVERQPSAAEVERREIGVGGDDLRQLLQQHGRAPIRAAVQDVE